MYSPYFQIDATSLFLLMIAQITVSGVKVPLSSCSNTVNNESYVGGKFCGLLDFVIM